MEQTELISEIRIQKIETRLAEIEKTLNNVLGNHETFMQGLEDAARELMKNDLIRVTIPAAFRDKLNQYVALREQQREQQKAKLVPEQKPTEQVQENAATT